MTRKQKPLVSGFLKFGAGNETRTRDPNLGKVVLYQLSYSRFMFQPQILVFQFFIVNTLTCRATGKNR